MPGTQHPDLAAPEAPSPRKSRVSTELVLATRDAAQGTFSVVVLGPRRSFPTLEDAAAAVLSDGVPGTAYFPVRIYDRPLAVVETTHRRLA